jgi:hypothetical protein
MPDRQEPLAPKQAFRRKTAIYLAAALVVLGLAERAARVLVSRRVLPTAGAEWIWAPGALERSEGLAFYAVRDFELSAPPDRARVHLLADEAYILYVNGRRVGSGGYFSGAPLDTYALDGMLRPGWNRVAVELRSRRGAGGLLLALFAEGERPAVVRSGRDWRIFHDATGVVEGTRPLEDGEPALVWQSPPTGGWGVPRLAPERSTFDRVVVAEEGRLDAAPLEPRTAPRPVTEDGSPLLSDFGRPVSGYLLFEGLAALPRRLRIEVGLERGGGEDIDVLLADGQSDWSTAEVRTLRFVGSPLLPEGAHLSVVGVDPAFAKQDAERAVRRREGVFGVEPPRRGAHSPSGF